MTKTGKIFLISGLIVLAVGLAVGAYFFLKAPDQTVWYNDAGELHRANDQPADIGHHENGEIRSKTWHLNGQLHRENDQPALIWYDENGEIESEAWYLNGQLIKENRPASN